MLAATTRMNSPTKQDPEARPVRRAGAGLLAFGARAAAWQAAAARALGDADAGGEGNDDADLAQRIAHMQPGATLLFFVERPDLALAARLHAGAAVDLHALLGDWVRQHRELLRQIERHRQHCMVVDSAELPLAAPALAAALSARLGVAVKAPESASAAAAIDALTLLIAAEATRGQRQVWALFEELQAHCLPLAGSVALAASPALAGPARERLQQLLARDRAAGDLAGQVTAERQAHAAALTAQRAEAERLQSHLAALAGRAAQAEAAQEAFTQELHRTQQRLEETQQGSVALRAENAALGAQLQQQIDARQAHDALAAREQDLQAEAWTAEREGLTSALEQAGAEAVRLEQRLIEAEAWAQERSQQLLRELAAAREQATDSAARVEGLETTLLAAATELAQAHDQQRRHEDEFARQRRELQSLQQQLPALQGELAAARAQTAESQARAERLDAAASDSQHRLHEQQRRHELLASEFDLAQRMQRQADDELAQEQRAALLLQQQLRNVLDELDHYYRHWVALESAQRHHMPAYAAELGVTAFELGAVAEGAPHRHIGAELIGVQSPLGLLPRLSVRLIEHHGRPGLALFQARDALPPLSLWVPSGSELNQAYMTLVPEDAATRALLSRMASADWAFVNALAALFARELSQPAAAPQLRLWATVAGRLCRQLQELPPRLRYDRLAVDAGPEPGTLRLCFGEALFGAQALHDIRVDWQPGRGKIAAPVQWLLPADASVAPLATWPLADDGMLAPAFTLPVGPGWNGLAARRAWSRMPESDRGLLLALLDALPAAAARAEQHSGAPGRGRAELESEAAALHRQARRALSSQRLRSATRSIVRRGLQRLGTRSD